jgi:hypothetical protein
LDKTIKTMKELMQKKRKRMLILWIMMMKILEKIKISIMILRKGLEHDSFLDS